MFAIWKVGVHGNAVHKFFNLAVELAGLRLHVCTKALEQRICNAARAMHKVADTSL